MKKILFYVWNSFFIKESIFQTQKNIGRYLFFYNSNRFSLLNKKLKKIDEDIKLNKEEF